MTVYSGRCSCGAVTFEVAGEPLAEGYCHCRDCAQWGASPVSAFVVLPAGSVALTRGSDMVATFNKTPKVNRKFCRNCGGHVLSVLAEEGLEEIYPDTLADYPFAPTFHIHYASKTLALRDGLPKFRDMPADLGGSGEMLPE